MKNYNIFLGRDGTPGSQGERGDQGYQGWWNKLSLHIRYNYLLLVCRQIGKY